MFKHYLSFISLALTIFTCVEKVKSAELSGISWIFRGNAQQNNTVLTFNVYDTLNLICRADGDVIYGVVLFAVSKGSTPTDMTLVSGGTLSISDLGTLIWSDVDGIQSGFENFNIYGNSYKSGQGLNNDYRYLNVATLKATDSGTYVCSGAYILSLGTSTPAFTSGNLIVTVNTKAGQARSSRSRFSSFFTYSAAILGASTLVL